MAEQTEQKEQTTSNQGSGAGSTALKAAAAAAAAGAAAIVARKAFSGHDGESNGASRENGSSKSGSKSTALSSIAAGGWDAARDALLPAAEDAAGAAGAFVAENAPEIVRDRIVPRFIQSFNDARGS